MEFTIDRDIFLKSLSRANGIIEKKTTLPILSNILIEAKESKIKIKDLEILVHGTTVATNSIIEGKLAKTVFITTEGFRDLLEIQRQIRPSLNDLLF